MLDDQTANDLLSRQLQQLASDLLAMAETGGELSPAIEAKLETWLADAERSGLHTLASLVKQVCSRQLDLATFLLRSRYLHSLSLQARHSAELSTRS